MIFRFERGRLPRYTISERQPKRLRYKSIYPVTRKRVFLLEATLQAYADACQAMSADFANELQIVLTTIAKLMFNQRNHLPLERYLN